MRKRIILIISLTLLAMFLITAIATRLIIIDSFMALEKEYMEKDVARFLGALEDAKEGLDLSVKDWAEWNETFDFIKNRSADYKEDNLDGTLSFHNLNVNIMVFADTSGTIIYKKAVNLDGDLEMPFPLRLLDYLERHPDLLRRGLPASSIQGIVSMGSEPLMIAIRPVMSSQGEGPVGGSLLMGRFIDRAEMFKISERSKLFFTVEQLGSPASSADFAAAEDLLQNGTRVFVRPLDVSTLAGYTILRDVYDQPSYTVRVESPREVMSQGLRVVAYVTSSLILISMVFGLVIMLYMERALISRVHLLSSGVLSIGTSNTLSQRLSVSGRDEIAYLGAAINGMLDALERSTEDLRRSEGRNEALLAAIPNMILRLSGDGTLIDFRWPAATALRPPPKGMLGLNVRAIPSVFPFLPEETVEKILSAAAQSGAFGGAKSFEFRTVENGSEYFFEARIVAGPEAETIVFIQEITSEKKAKEAQRKEIFLKEIHHRVKNNLQVISSLLDLQARASKDERVVSMLKESQNRLRSMSLIHEKLYATEESRGVSFSEYIHDLAAHLRNSYAQNARAVKMEVDVDEISMDMDLAVPCGLIISELVSNALKYAFPDGRAGTVRIGLHPGEDWTLVLTVADDGVGVPPEVSYTEPATLGLRIVSSLANQLKGTLKMDASRGTVFTLTIPLL